VAVFQEFIHLQHSQYGKGKKGFDGIKMEAALCKSVLKKFYADNKTNENKRNSPAVLANKQKYTPKRLLKK